MAILRKREELDHINVDNEVIQYIASNVRSNIRELEGSLTKIVAFGKLNHMEVNLELAQNVLRDIIDPNVKQEITPQFIIQVVAEHYGISELDLVGTKRTKELATARQVAMYLCREMTEVISAEKTIRQSSTPSKRYPQRLRITPIPPAL